MNLRQLQYFVEVGEVQSITKAAARLNLAQPALTRHMRTLEGDLGVQLLTRSGRGIALTNAGALFLDRIKGILRDLERARVEAETASRSPGGQIGLGLPASISRALTRAVVQRFKAQLPKMQVRVIDGWSGFIVEWLLLGRLDVVVGSVHSLLRSEERAMTVRMVTALANPHLDILGHCTGRMRTRRRNRPPSAFDAELVFAAAARFDKAIEINSRPERLDPPKRLLRLAIEAGCRVAIDSDAHTPGQLFWLGNGCERAFLSGVTEPMIINAMPADDLLAWTAAHT